MCGETGFEYLDVGFGVGSEFERSVVVVVGFVQ